MVARDSKDAQRSFNLAERFAKVLVNDRIQVAVDDVTGQKHDFGREGVYFLDNASDSAAANDGTQMDVGCHDDVQRFSVSRLLLNRNNNGSNTYHVGIDEAE